MLFKLHTSFLFITLCIACSYAAIDSITIDLSFNGASPSCSSCTSGEYATNFACDDGRGNWNNGYMYFQDPIPQGNVVYNVSATVQGWFSGNASSDLVGILFMAGHILGDAILPVSDNTSCSNCMSAAYFVSNTNLNGLPNYAYGHNNSLQFENDAVYTSVACISTVAVTIQYGPTQYAVRRISPNNGPSTGGTPITILGEHFAVALSAICSFGGYLTPATIVNNTVITCVSPASTCTKFPCEVTVEIAGANLGFTNNHVKFKYTDGGSSGENKDKEHLLLTILGIGIAFVVVIVGVGVFIWYHKRKAKLASAEQTSLLKK